MSYEPGIPSAQQNPFIKQTKLPEGTLFIIFGSILLGLFVIVLAWRLYFIWAAYKAATFNESKFTSLEPVTGGPFVDPVENLQFNSDEENEGKESVLKPIKQRGKHRPKTQLEKIEEARLQGSFFSPTAEVLNQSTNYNNRDPSNRNSMRFSITQTGRNSSMKLSSMSNDELDNPYAIPKEAYMGRQIRPLSTLSLQHGGSMGGSIYPPSGPLESRAGSRADSMASGAPTGPFIDESSNYSESYYPDSAYTEGSAPTGPYTELNDGPYIEPLKDHAGSGHVTPTGPPTGPLGDAPTGPLGAPMSVPMGPHTGSHSEDSTHNSTEQPGSQVPVHKPRTKKLRPPSTYLDDLMN